VTTLLKDLIDGVRELENNGVLPTEPGNAYRVELTPKYYDELLRDPFISAILGACTPKGLRPIGVLNMRIYIRNSDGTISDP